jgi:hypothetical protein
MFEKLCLPAMCLELGDNSIRYPVGIAEDAPIKVGEIRFDIYGEMSTFKFQPCFDLCNTFNVKFVPPHRGFIKEEPKNKE